jgi:hypothetical protein
MPETGLLKCDKKIVVISIPHLRLAGISKSKAPSSKIIRELTRRFKGDSTSLSLGKLGPFAVSSINFFPVIEFRLLFPYNANDM